MTHRPRLAHFHRPDERPFTADERGRVTVLIGGLTSAHEILLKAVLEHAGHRCDTLPTPDVAAFQVGKDYGNNAQCNPSYFCVGSLLQYLRGLEAQGLSRREIIDGYVYFTAGTCGPCRFGMYESEYRLALRNAGFDGFRVLVFMQNDGVKARRGEPGLRFTVDLGMGAMAAFNAGDVLNDVLHRIRPYEVTEGETTRVFDAAIGELGDAFRSRRPFDLAGSAPAPVARRLNPRHRSYIVANSVAKVVGHLYGPFSRDMYARCRSRLAAIEVDWLRVKPVVKVLGEFWAQTTEGDGNFRMFEFLEREGAEVHVEPISCWVAYLLYQRRVKAALRREIDAPHPDAPRWAVRDRLANWLQFRRRSLVFAAGERFWMRRYARVVSALGGLAAPLVSQAELARLAHPFYHQLARGGEGHLEVGKSIHATLTHACHMVLSLKPFGCLPSTQSDGVHAAVVSRYPDMLFLPIETSGEGQINAYSRVQMTLAEAKALARAEFDRALASSGRTLGDIRAFVADHPELRHPFYPIPRRRGVVGVAANFVLHVSDLMAGRARLRVGGPVDTQRPALATRSGA